MHLLATEPGIIADGAAAIDLAQTPGDIIPLALLPGDDKPDAELAELSTVPQAACRRLWRYLAEGGPGNADNFLRYAATLLGPAAPHPNPLPASGERGPPARFAETFPTSG